MENPREIKNPELFAKIDKVYNRLIMTKSLIGLVKHVLKIELNEGCQISLSERMNAIDNVYLNLDELIDAIEEIENIVAGRELDLYDDL